MFTVSILVFWLLRERSYTGDWQAWTGFVEHGPWYRLREPLCVPLYRLPYLALGGWVSAQDVLRAGAYLCGAISMCLILAIVRQLTASRVERLLSVVAFASAYGVVGNFFGHLEHYAVLSVGVFGYVYCALRVLRGDLPVWVAAAVLSALLATHLAAIWMVPSLFLLPFLRTEGGNPSPNRQLAMSALMLGIPNLIVWIAILLTYYHGSLQGLWDDVWTGSFSRAHYGVGNALGGRAGTPSALAEPSARHLLSIGALLCIYTPFGVLGGLILLGRLPWRPRPRSSPNLRFFLSLLVPYLLFTLWFSPGLGYARDWDLFSHVSIFLILVVIEGGVLRVDGGLRMALVVGSLLLSCLLTAYLVIETAREATPPGVTRVLEAVGVDTGPRPGGRRPVRARSRSAELGSARESN